MNIFIPKTICTYFICVLACGLGFPILPYGLDRSDQMLARVDDGYSLPITLSPPIPLFGEIETMAYVSMYH